MDKNIELVTSNNIPVVTHDGKRYLYILQTFMQLHQLYKYIGVKEMMFLLDIKSNEIYPEITKEEVSDFFTEIHNLGITYLRGISLKTGKQKICYTINDYFPRLGLLPQELEE